MPPGRVRDACLLPAWPEERVVEVLDFCQSDRWICGRGELVEGPCSCWQRRLAAEPGRVSRRAARLPRSPPRRHGPPRLVSYQPVTSSRFPALHQEGRPVAQSRSQARRSVCPGEGVTPAPLSLRAAPSPPAPLCPSFLAAEGEMIQLTTPGVTESQRGCAWGTKNLEGTEYTVPGSCEKREQPRRMCTESSKCQARSQVPSAGSLPGRMVQW